MIIEGKTIRFGNNVNTDEIIPARYLSTHDPAELAKYCMEGITPGFGQRKDIKNGIIFAGENFGCGSSREHAPISIKTSGIKCVVAKSFARIFLRNSINIGLPVVELQNSDGFINEDLIRIDFTSGILTNINNGQVFKIPPYPEFIQKIISSGGWMNYSKEMIGERKKNE